MRATILPLSILLALGCASAPERTAESACRRTAVEGALVIECAGEEGWSGDAVGEAQREMEERRPGETP